MYEFTIDTITPLVEFITSEAALLFGLLFLNNVLMYFALSNRHTAEVRELTQAHEETLRCANSANGTLRSIVHAFSDELGVEAPEATFDCRQSHHNGGKCYIEGEHVH
jgi:hypothetical protein